MLHRRTLLSVMAGLALVGCGVTGPSADDLKKFVDEVVARVRETCGVIVTVTDLIAAVTNNDYAKGVDAFATAVCGLVSQEAPQVAQAGAALKSGRPRSGEQAQGVITVNGKPVHVAA